MVVSKLALIGGGRNGRSKNLWTLFWQGVPDHSLLQPISIERGQPFSSKRHPCDVRGLSGAFHQIALTQIPTRARSRSASVTRLSYAMTRCDRRYLDRRMPPLVALFHCAPPARQTAFWVFGQQFHGDNHHAAWSKVHAVVFES